MKKILLCTAIMATAFFGSCQKDKRSSGEGYGNGPSTNVPASLQGNWMYGHFSMTEYWNQNPSEYIGNAFQFAIAFKFNANGTYEQYFTSSSVTSGVTTYNQSVTKGTIEINEANGTIITHAFSAHYKRTKNGRTEEDRDLQQSEITATTNYTYTTGTEASGTKAIYLKLNGTSDPLPFLKKF